MTAYLGFISPCQHKNSQSEPSQMTSSPLHNFFQVLFAGKGPFVSYLAPPQIINTVHCVQLEGLPQWKEGTQNYDYKFFVVIVLIYSSLWQTTFSSTSCLWWSFWLIVLIKLQFNLTDNCCSPSVLLAVSLRFLIPVVNTTKMEVATGELDFLACDTVHLCI